ncbi:MAG TPA: hypothetical protein VLV85_18605 [Stellaceae bacterium]|nr:hypothetical protein [Stellaceae bacterium]
MGGKTDHDDDGRCDRKRQPMRNPEMLEHVLTVSEFRRQRLQRERLHERYD